MTCSEWLRVSLAGPGLRLTRTVTIGSGRSVCFGVETVTLPISSNCGASSLPPLAPGSNGNDSAETELLRLSRSTCSG
eukprot:2957733-Rhodomonas_salina.1